MSTISASTTTTTAYKVTADTTGALVLQTGATPTTAVTIDTSQNVGIGTTSPGSKLDIGSGTLRIKNASGDSQGLLIYQAAADTSSIFNYYSGPLAFGTNNTERARIDSSGNLLVGTTSTVANGGTKFVLDNGGGGNSNWQIGHKSGTASGEYYSLFYYGASVVGSITQNGTTGVLYNLTSDYRLKNNQQPLTGAKDFVMALQPKKWQWWDGSGEGVGFIAHEFMEVAKYSGHGEKDAVDADGKPVYQSIQPSSSEVMANLVAFIQEQQALITQLQADVAALKGQA